MINRTENLSKSNQTKQEAIEHIMYIRMRKELGRERKVGYPTPEWAKKSEKYPLKKQGQRVGEIILNFVRTGRTAWPFLQGPGYLQSAGYGLLETYIGVWSLAWRAETGE